MAATEASAGATRAIDDLYRRHVGEIYRYAYAVLGNHADAEDVTQTTFVNALRALERGERPRDPSHWLVAIAHNIVRQRWRQAAARPSEVELYDVPSVSEPEQQESLEELVRALQRIPPAQREAIVMRELEGRSYQEIAGLMGISIGALETLLFRARRSLAEEMENLVTCDRAELALTRQVDGRLSRKERRRLTAHLDECPSCARFAKSQQRTRRSFRGLAVLPLPIGLTLFKGAPSASAVGLPSIGLGAGAAAGSAVSAGTVAGGVAVGSGIAGGAALKIAAVVAAVGVASGVGYKGVEASRDDPAPRTAVAREAARGKVVVAATSGTPSSTRSAGKDTTARGAAKDAAPAAPTVEADRPRHSQKPRVERPRDKAKARAEGGGVERGKLERGTQAPAKRSSGRPTDGTKRSPKATEAERSGNAAGGRPTETTRQKGAGNAKEASPKAPVAATPDTGAPSTSDASSPAKASGKSEVEPSSPGQGKPR